MDQVPSEAPELVLEPYLTGTGTVESSDSILRFVVTGATSRQYSDAQIDDYQGLPRRQFRWRPPCTMSVQARFSHPEGELRGTAGFGFWNDPFLMSGKRVPALPRAIWFFYGSPQSNIKLDLDIPGCGWKAATLDAAHRAGTALLPLAPFLAILMNVGSVYRALWPRVQRQLAIHERLVPIDMTEWHTYEIVWRERRSDFLVDGETHLAGARSPRGPLGFVMWMDNQYLIATPQGKLRWGLLAIREPQWMEVSRVQIDSGSGDGVHGETRPCD
jgi:hypothetical protein